LQKLEQSLLAKKLRRVKVVHDHLREKLADHVRSHHPSDWKDVMRKMEVEDDADAPSSSPDGVVGHTTFTLTACFLSVGLILALAAWVRTHRCRRLTSAGSAADVRESALLLDVFIE